MQNLVAENITKSFHGITVLENVSYTFKAGSITCIMGNSGIGKTTFLRILTGLEKPERGSVTGGGKPSVMFQEDRLIEQLNAIENVKLVLKHKNAAALAEEELKQLLPKESLKKAVSQLSGGMRRRVALVRAMLAESDTVFLDEPFTGLDLETMRQAVAYIKSRKGSKTLILVTHDREVCEMLQAKICLLTSSKAVATIT